MLQDIVLDQPLISMKKYIGYSFPAEHSGKLNMYILFPVEVCLPVLVI